MDMFLQTGTRGIWWRLPEHGACQTRETDHLLDHLVRAGRDVALLFRDTTMLHPTASDIIASMIFYGR